MSKSLKIVSTKLSESFSVNRHFFDNIQKLQKRSVCGGKKENPFCFI